MLSNISIHAAAETQVNKHLQRGDEEEEGIIEEIPLDMSGFAKNVNEPSAADKAS
jgi:hypothetical protein